MNGQEDLAVGKNSRRLYADYRRNRLKREADVWNSKNRPRPDIVSKKHLLGNGGILRTHCNERKNEHEKKGEEK